MGTWGAKLYQDDIAEDVRDYYKDQLKRGKTNEQIMKVLITDNEDIIIDEDEASVFWFALADTQWNLGRLLPFVKEKAINYLNSKSDLTKWEEQGNKKDYKIREKVLKELEEKLKSEMPIEKKLTQYKLYKCEWKIGDVFAYKIESKYAKEKGLYHRYFLLQKVDETSCYPGHIIPIIRVKITESEILPENKSEFDKLEYVHINPKYIKGIVFMELRIQMLSRSKRSIPKKLELLRNDPNIDIVKNEYIETEKLSRPLYTWNVFEEIIIDKYCKYNLNN